MKEKMRYLLATVFRQFKKPTDPQNLTKAEFYQLAGQFLKEYDEYVPNLWREHYSGYIERKLAKQPLTAVDYNTKTLAWEDAVSKAERKFRAYNEAVLANPEMHFGSWFQKLADGTTQSSTSGQQRKIVSKKAFVTGFWNAGRKLGFRLDQPWETFGLRDAAVRILGEKTQANNANRFDDFLQGGEDGKENPNEPVSAVDALDSNYADALTAPKLTVDDFELLNVVGKGSFGKVMQVRHKGTGEILAMKTLKKSVLVKRRQVAHTQTERKILGTIKHPFIVSLRYAFQTKTKLYMILDYFNGGELFFHLRDGRFKENRCRFYAAELACALQCLHNNNIIYRDLKPENVLLDASGHIKLTDFGLSKEAADLTHTFCGTPAYLAPEVIAGEYYGKIVDWWSLGTLLYEMLCGLPPFYHSNQNQMYKLIMYAKLEFPSHLSAGAISILKKLLRRDPVKRMGYKSGLEELKTEPFFDGIDWKALERREVTPPIIPVVKAGKMDITNMDEEFTREMPKDSPDVINSVLLNKGGALKFDKFTFDGNEGLTTA
jgi:serine/threonine protein kinase